MFAQTQVKHLPWKEAVPRVLADLVIVHLSIIGAFTISVMYQDMNENWVEAHKLISGFQIYYAHFFWFFAPLFPLTFHAFGFYTHTRFYNGRHKTRVVLQGVATALALFLGATFFLFPQGPVGRSVALPFAVLVAIGISGLRVAKVKWNEKFEVVPKGAASLVANQSTVLVLGGAGYIGSILVRRLLDAGKRVRVLDSLLYGASSLAEVMRHPNLELIVGDCRNIGDVVGAMRQVSSVVHLAAIVGDPACEQDRQAALEVNYAATRMLIEIAKAHRIGRLIFASSCSVYGESDTEVDEHADVKPLSLYALSKVQAERALLASRSESFNPTIVRFATLFGLGHRPRFDLVVNLLCAKAHYEKVITIYNGEQWRPFLHVRDAAESLALLLDAPLPLVTGETFNVGDRRLNHTLSQLAEKILKAFPGTRIEHVDNPDRRNYRVSFEKIRCRLDFGARQDLDVGIAEWKRAFENNVINDYKDIRYHNERFLQTVRSVTKNKSDLDGRLMAALSGSDGIGH